MANIAIDVMWDDNPVDVTAEANFIWSIANKLRGSYMPDKYGDVIIPMTIIRRFECALLDDEVKRRDVIDLLDRIRIILKKRCSGSRDSNFIIPAIIRYRNFVMMLTM